jgi:hypothetical protein
MTFTLGQKKPAASGRKPGTPNKRTRLVRAVARSATQICQMDGDDPISIMVDAARFLNAVAGAYAPCVLEGSTPQEIKEAVLAAPRGNLEVMRKFMVDASGIAAKVAEFGYAKLRRIDYAGDAPVPASADNRMVFVLNVDGGPRSVDPVPMEGSDGPHKIGVAYDDAQ